MASSNHRSPARYQQGEWFGVVREGTVVLLGPDTPHALIDTVWELLAFAPEAHEVLHEVTEAFGVSLSRIPPFGIIDAKDALRVFLRGELELLVHLDGGQERITGRDVTTWTERRIADAVAYSVRIGGSTTPLDHPSLKGTALNTLPLAEGVVLLESIDVVMVASAAGAEAEAEAVAEDEAEVEAEAIYTPAPERVSDETMIGFPEPEPEVEVEPEPEPEVEPEPELIPEVEPEPEPEPEAAELPVHTSTTDPLVPSLENTTNYDHLWDKTVMRNIEDAAVRIDDDAENAHEAPAPSVAPTPSAAPAPSVAPTPSDAPSPPTPPAAETTAAASGPAPAESAVGQVQAVPATGLIDSVPWLRSSSGTSTAVGSQSAAPTGQAAEPAPQMPTGWSPALPPQPQAPPAAEDPDHDGQTIMKSSLPVGDDAAAQQPGEGAATVNGPSVLARVCSAGHANPPTYPQCSVCGVALSGDAVHVPRPRLGRVRISTGELIDLDQSLIIGRQPSVSRVQGGTMPRLIQVESPGGDISRSHVEVRLEGWHVMLCDLKATNGTVLIREGQAPRRLAQNEMAILLDGDIAELGDDISLRFEEIL